MGRTTASSSSSTHYCYTARPYGLDRSAPSAASLHTLLRLCIAYHPRVVYHAASCPRALLFYLCLIRSSSRSSLPTTSTHEQRDYGHDQRGHTKLAHYSHGCPAHWATAADLPAVRDNFSHRTVLAHDSTPAAASAVITPAVIKRARHRHRHAAVRPKHTYHQFFNNNCPAAADVECRSAVNVCVIRM